MKAEVPGSHLPHCKSCLRRSIGLAISLSVAALLSVGLFSSQSAVIESWVQRLNTVQRAANDFATAVVRDAAGDVIVAGTTDNRTTSRDLIVIKYAGADGSVLWQYRYDGPAHNYDGAQVLALAGDSHVVVAGHSSNGTNTDYYIAKLATADGALIWDHRFKGQNSIYTDAKVFAAVDASGNALVTAISPSNSGTNDFYIAKYAADDGALLWEQRYNGPGNGVDVPQAIAVDTDGNAVVTGYSAGAGTGFDYYTAKYGASDGALIWEKRYDGPGNGNDYAAAVAVDHLSNVLVTGRSADDYYTAKYAAADGALLWEQRYNGPADKYDEATTVLVDSSDDVVVSGSSDSTNNLSGYYVAKYAATDGAVIWDKWSTNSGAIAALDGYGNVAVAGRSYPDGGGLYVATYAGTDGELLWEHIRRMSQWDRAVAIAVEANGDVAVARTAQGTDYKNNDWITAEFAASDGGLIWEQRYDGPASGNDRPAALGIDRSGNVVVTGTSGTLKYAAANGAVVWKKPQAYTVAVEDVGNVALLFNSWNGNQFENSVARYSPEGDLIWQQRYSETITSYSPPVLMTVDGSGNVVVTGVAYGTNTTDLAATDYYTAKYAAADGALVWEQRYNGPANDADRPLGVAVDPQGNVVVTGSSTSLPADGFEDFFTIKYAASNGDVLWQRRYNGPANRDDEARAVAVDRSGNVIVTGSSGNGTNTDYYTTKYAAADGGVLWERRYNGPTNGNDVANAVVVDANGNVVVTGYSTGSGSVTDYYTAKYSGANGSVVWEKRYRSPVNNYSVGQKVAVDQNGNAIVAGYSGGSYYTTKYAAADGAMLWDQRLNVPPNFAAYVAGLGVAPEGTIALTGFCFGSWTQGVLPDFDYVTVVYRDTLPRVSIEIASGGVRLRFTGTAGQRYDIQRAECVAGPWSTLATPTAPLSGLIEFLDTSPLPGAAFYRTATTNQ